MTENYERAQEAASEMNEARNIFSDIGADRLTLSTDGLSFDIGQYLRMISVICKLVGVLPDISAAQIKGTASGGVLIEVAMPRMTRHAFSFYTSAPSIMTDAVALFANLQDWAEDYSAGYKPPACPLPYHSDSFYIGIRPGGDERDSVYRICGETSTIVDKVDW